MMKKMSIATFIIYNYYLAKARFRSIKPAFLTNIVNANPLQCNNSIKTIQRCYIDAYYETYILPYELEAHDRMVSEYLAQAPKDNQ